MCKKTQTTSNYLSILEYTGVCKVILDLRMCEGEGSEFALPDHSIGALV